MDVQQTSRFTVTRSGKAVPADQRAVLLADPGFGKLFTDHMVTIRYTEGQGWHSHAIGPREPFQLDPACAVLHYAQEIFEGMKAYRLEDGSIAMFRPEENAHRFAESAERMAMPVLPEELFLEAVELLVKTDADWIPGGEGSLYLRPFMFASETFLGVRPANEYIFCVIASPAGAYFKGGKKAVTLWVSEHFTRAARGGTGAAKCGGNYAASLVAQKEAISHGCDQVVFLDAAENKWVEELGGMNVFFVMDDGSIVTPPLSGTILPGITRNSIISLARAKGHEVREEPYSFAQWRADAASGKLREAFACGTAAVVTAIGTVKSINGDFTIGNGDGGIVTEALRADLTGIQRGTVADPANWVRKL
ncbi:branched-chain amino acid aminotransferase [Sphingobium indicum IP26]|uniref:Branched-chain-amino-acid aminotransferase n=1 Tax=Sphingobium indicum F2 TaxID=1450518 RepID=A0A8E0WQH7_9SPHN|nr:MULTISPECIES: branched-chain amino acid aminotransferase [Sphingobium]EPR18739.1 branched-chain amino acid aminotransferase [Sphingobium indicum IP26]EQB00376.1 branched-chain amino acid aminotransferase [Sphingobium sp. HDIP04]KER35374.1 branched-chain amino acid aminotransferase [Sphingobium indicum F2]KER36061.1 branched-chain amino acid aminotransferase [Sphingobium indicum F2]